MYKQNKIINKEIELIKKNQMEILLQKRKNENTIGVECSPESFNMSKLTNQKKN